jgi:hypothetical protein
MMGRFILRYTGSGPTPASFVEQVRSHQDVSILDESPHMLLVDGPEAVLRRLLETSSCPRGRCLCPIPGHRWSGRRTDRRYASEPAVPHHRDQGRVAGGIRVHPPGDPHIAVHGCTPRRFYA